MGLSDVQEKNLMEALRMSVSIFVGGVRIRPLSRDIAQNMAANEAFDEND